MFELSSRGILMGVVSTQISPEDYETAYKTTMKASLPH